MEIIRAACPNKLDIVVLLEKSLCKKQNLLPPNILTIYFVLKYINSIEKEK